MPEALAGPRWLLFGGGGDEGQRARLNLAYVVPCVGASVEACARGVDLTAVMAFVTEVYLFFVNVWLGVWHG